jgi:hypothetical protein
MYKITSDDIQNIVNNTKIITEKYFTYSTYDYTELHYSIIGKTPYRSDMCINREGSIVISPQILITPKQIPYDLQELAGLDDIQIDARILFFNNYKLQFNEFPVQRYKKNIDDVCLEIEKNFSKEKNENSWAVIKTPDSKLWRLSLLHYISKKVFKKNNGGSNRLNNYL